MFIIEDNAFKSVDTNKKFPTLSMIFDLKSKKLICHGSTNAIMKKYDALKSDSSKLFSIMPAIATFDSVDQDTCDKINMLISYDNYAEIWLHNNGYL